MNPLGLIYSLQFVALLVFAGAYYKAADIENASGILWAGMSVTIFLITWLFFHWGFPGIFFGQFLLLAGITAVRVLRDYKKSD